MKHVSELHSSHVIYSMLLLFVMCYSHAARDKTTTLATLTSGVGWRELQARVFEGGGCLLSANWNRAEGRGLGFTG